MDMSRYLDVFLEESVEYLQNLNEYLLKLENNPDDKETTNAIFRVAHTLKGMAGSMGFTDMGELTHNMENVLDKFKSGKLKVTTEVTNLLFQCLDTLELMVDNIQNGIDEKVDITELIDRIRKTDNSNNEKAIIKDNIKKTDEEEFNGYEIDLILEAQKREYNVYKIYTEIYKDTQLKAARAYLVYNTIEELGEIIKSVPIIEDIENERFENFFVIYVISKEEPQNIKKAIEGISEIQKVEVSKVELQASSSDENKNEKDNNKNKHENKDNDDKAQRKVHQSVRVDLERLDKFMNLVGELVIHRTRLEQISSGHKLTDLNESLEQVGRITSDLQDLVMKIRMLPVERVFNRFPRMVRDLAQELNKEIEFVVQGEDTELDRTVIDEIGEPLVHLIRNAADHGLENSVERIKKGKNSKGIIKLSAYQQGNQAVIKIEDDGKGLNIEKIRQKAITKGIDTEGMTDKDIKNLIFMSGFSTSDEVTDVSGRGVGMDVVKTKISSLGGTIDVISEKDKGTTIIIRLPLTLSIINTLLVKVGEETFAIPLGFIDRVINFNIDDIKKTNNKDVIIYRESIIPLIKVAEKLNLKEEENKDKFIVIVKVGERTAGLLVDFLIGQQEIVIKPLSKIMKGLKEYVGATILGDGLVTLILDVANLI